jgi:hypothetical protein
VVPVGVDRPDDDDAIRPPAPDTRAPAAPDVPAVADPRDSELARQHLRSGVQAEYRAYAIDRGCDRVRETEETTVTPAMRRIEAEDPTRHLVGLEFRLKERERLEEKVAFDMKKKGISAAEAFDNVKDAIRYTFQYSEEDYSRGVRSDCVRLAEEFELVECRNSWTKEEYKGINSRWRVPGCGQLFEVQFHTDASFEAKQETHWAYEKLRAGVPAEEQRELEQYQRGVTARVCVPLGAPDIPDHP